MKKFITIFSALTLIFITSCKTNSETSYVFDTYGVSVQSAKTMKPDTLNTAQMDSVLKADNLPAIQKWVSANHTDAETKRTNTYKTLYDNTTNVIYTIKIINNNMYILSKRKLSVR